MALACITCKKSPPEVSLQRCARCPKARYCSRVCQTADWPSHKASCGQGTSKPKKQTVTTDNNPFLTLSSGKWLHDRPKEEVYGLLLDAYRLRVEDLYVFEGTAEHDSTYGGQPNGLQGFRRYMRKVSSKPGVLPPWWNKDTSMAECERLGMSDGWHDLRCAIEKSDVIEHYKTSMMPMQLRMFSESVFGTYPGAGAGQGAAIMKAMAAASAQNEAV